MKVAVANSSEMIWSNPNELISALIQKLWFGDALGGKFSSRAPRWFGEIFNVFS